MSQKEIPKVFVDREGRKWTLAEKPRNIFIKVVSLLDDGLRKRAKNMGWRDDDIVLVRMDRLEGSPLDALQRILIGEPTAKPPEMTPKQKRRAAKRLREIEKRYG